ncbi:MAG: response regulator [Oscillospiraceae bacterium]
MYKVLIADDDYAVRYAYSKMKIWNENGFEITNQVSNGKLALDALKADKFDLIITDICMPMLDGIELLREIRKINIDVEVVFVSTYNEFEYARQGLILGAFDYLLKPVKNYKLREVLKRAKEKLDEKNYNRISESCVKMAFHHFNMQTNTAFAEKLFQFLSAKENIVITMEDAAEHFEITKDYFGKLFKQNFNISFNHFYSVLKVEYAKLMIREYNYKAYEISEMLGYSSRDYFTKIFKEVTGKTPTEYKTDVF